MCLQSIHAHLIIRQLLKSAFVYHERVIILRDVDTILDLYCRHAERCPGEFAAPVEGSAQRFGAMAWSMQPQ